MIQHSLQVKALKCAWFWFQRASAVAAHRLVSGLLRARHASQRPEAPRPRDQGRWRWRRRVLVARGAPRTQRRHGGRGEVPRGVRAAPRDVGVGDEDGEEGGPVPTASDGDLGAEQQSDVDAGKRAGRDEGLMRVELSLSLSNR